MKKLYENSIYIFLLLLKNIIIIMQYRNESVIKAHRTEPLVGSRFANKKYTYTSNPGLLTNLITCIMT